MSPNRPRASPAGTVSTPNPRSITSTGPPLSRCHRWRTAAGTDIWPEADTRYCLIASTRSVYLVRGVKLPSLPECRPRKSAAPCPQIACFGSHCPRLVVANLVEGLVPVGGIFPRHPQYPLADDVALYLVAPPAQAETLPEEPVDSPVLRVLRQPCPRRGAGDLEADVEMSLGVGGGEQAG